MTPRRPYPSWARWPRAAPATVERPEWADGLPDLAGLGAPALAYGRGRSYGDVCLNDGGALVDTARLDRLIAFDRAAGVVRAQAGATLADVLAATVPHGWFLPVTPGTQFVTLGGAVANDVHGKNHRRAGTFGRHVRRLELVRSSGERLELAPGDPLFGATVAGLGLTGLVTWVELALERVPGALIETTDTPFGSLADGLRLLDAAAGRSPHAVAWLDALRPDRGVVSEGRHVAGAAGPARPRLRVPAGLPGWLLSRPTVRAFNALYARRPRARRERIPYASFFYPLDALRDWPRLYGAGGFVQYQPVVPHADAEAVFREILARVERAGAAPTLAVLKAFGDLASPGRLSFPMPGVTLALDLPHRGPETVALVRSLDEVTDAAGGRVYPAKDACMTPARFRSYYPGWRAFSDHVDPAFSSSFWRRVTAQP